jgi:uncharacterized membrane protein
LQPYAALAVNNDVKIDPPENFRDLATFGIGDYVKTAISLLLGFAGVIAFFYLLWGGVQWIMAGGDKEGTEKARKKITASLVGLTIVFSAYALLFIVKTLFGVNLLGGFTISKLGS